MAAGFIRWRGLAFLTQKLETHSAIFDYLWCSSFTKKFFFLQGHPVVRVADTHFLSRVASCLLSPLRLATRAGLGARRHDRPRLCPLPMREALQAEMRPNWDDSQIEETTQNLILSSWCWISMVYASPQLIQTLQLDCTVKGNLHMFTVTDHSWRTADGRSVGILRKLSWLSDNPHHRTGHLSVVTRALHSCLPLHTTGDLSTRALDSRSLRCTKFLFLFGPHCWLRSEFGRSQFWAATHL